jgi:hypothetical protein
VSFKVADAYVAVAWDDASLEDQLTEAVQGAASSAGAAGGDVLAQGLSAGVADGADEIQSALLDAMAGTGDVAGEQLAEGLVEGTSGAGDAISVELRGALSEAGSAAGEGFAAQFDAAAGELGDELPEQLRQAGEQGAQALDEALQQGANAGNIGGMLAAQISMQLRFGLDAQAQATMAMLATVLEAQGADAAAEAGASVGHSLIAAIGDAAAGEADGAAAQIGEALDASLGDALTAAGADSGDALMQSLSATLGDSTAGLEPVGAAAAAAFGTGFSETLQNEFEQADALATQMAMRLPQPFVNAYMDIRAGMEAATEDLEQLSATAMASLERLNLMIEDEGVQAADELAGRMAILQNYTPTMSFDQLSAAVAPAEGAAAAGAGAAAAGEGALGELMGGPAGMLLWQLPYLLTSLPSLLGGSSNSALTAITSAIQQAGGNPTSTAVASVQTAVNGNPYLTALEQQTGLSATNLIEAAVGSPTAQGQLNTAYGAAQAQDQQGAGYSQGGQEPGHGVAQPNQQQINLNQLQQADSAYNQIAAAVSNAADAQAQLNEQTAILDQTTTVLNGNLKEAYSQMALTATQSATTTVATMNLGAGMDAENQQLVRVATSYNIAQQQASAYSAALDAMNNTSGATVGALNNDAEYMTIFNKVMADNVQASDLSAQHSAQQSVAALNLGTSQGQLNYQLVQSETAYTEAANAGNAYSTLLTSLNGTAMSAAEAQTTLNQDLLSAQTSWAQNSYSLDQSTQAGITDALAAQQAATAISAVGASVEQQTGSVNQANAAMQQSVNAYVAATGATGQAKQAIIDYIDTILKIPPNVPTTVTANTQPALAQAEEAAAQISQLQATINVGANIGGVTNLIGPGLAHNAAGGPVQAGVPTVVGDGGRSEVFVPQTAGRIYPTVQQGMAALNAQGGSGVTMNFYGPQLPDGVQRMEMLRDFASVGAIG